MPRVAKQEARVWMKNVFRTKLELETDKLQEMAADGPEGEGTVRGSSTFYYSRNITDEVLAKIGGPPRYLDPKKQDIALTIGCDLPKGLWKVFSNDGIVEKAYFLVNGLSAKAVDGFADTYKSFDSTAWENRPFEGMSGQEFSASKEALARAQKTFDERREKTIAEFQKEAMVEIANFFTEKAETYADYKRYKAKASVKLVATSAALVASLAALATAATPAAPATIIPAITSIASSAQSIGKQIADLFASAEEIAVEIRSAVKNLKIEFHDGASNKKKNLVKAAEFGKGFLGSLTGNVSEIFIPSMKYLFNTVGQHKSKVDGLDVELHHMRISVNQLLDAQESAETILNRNKKQLKEKLDSGSRGDFGKAMTNVEKALAALDGLQAELNLMITGKIPHMIERVETGRKNNAKLQKTLKDIDEMLGTRGQKLIGPAALGELLGTLALIGSGFASTPAADGEILEKAMFGLEKTIEGLDLVREYAPEAWEKIVG
jgi:hypothetical protein